MARAVLLMLGLTLGVIVGLASDAGAGAGSNLWVGALGLAVLLLWSSLAFLLGREVGPARSAASDPAGEAGVVPWLATALVGLGMTLLWGDHGAFGVPLLWATILPAAVAYSGLLFDAGRARRRVPRRSPSRSRSPHPHG